MPYISIIFLIISIMCLFSSIFILGKSIYVTVIRIIMIKKILLKQKKYQYLECMNAINQTVLMDITALMSNINIIPNGYISQILLEDIALGKAIASIKEFPCIVGRGKMADIIIDYDITISKKHIIFTYEGDCIYIEDLRSINGTLVNDKKIYTKCMINNGDIIRIGETYLKLKLIKY